MKLDKWLNLRTLNDLKRFNIRTTLHEQNVASHSFYVTTLAMSIASELRDKYGAGLHSYSVAVLSLFHDSEESKLGDILIPSKSNFKEAYDDVALKMKAQILSDLNLSDIVVNELEGYIVRFADKLEGYIYCLEEIELGNSSFKDIADSYYVSLKSLVLEAPRYSEFFKELLDTVKNTRVMNYGG